MKKYRLIYQSSNIEAPEGTFDIGRSNECNLILDDPSVSRVHATIVNENELLFLEDRGSRNGCIVNGNRISGRVQLFDGDRITIGHQSIRVVALGKVANADRTLGLVTCAACGSWIANNEMNCPQCGAPRSSTGGDPKATFRVDPIQSPRRKSDLHKTQQPQFMVAALLQKAISMERFEEAEKLLANLMESAIKREQRGDKMEEREIEDVTRSTIAIAEATRNPKHVSNLFAFHHARGKLMPRETIEALYGLVRKVGYRSCPEMSRYLAFLATKATSFSPGEKFVHRRLEGLVSLCS
ncbi:MAG: FHA domain-containing protein [Proteobacteria bacterium]|jgi:urease gamma subunit|nr:FHA domain-containing protein [Pseudomonadota bacterium]